MAKPGSRDANAKREREYDRKRYPPIEQ